LDVVSDIASNHYTVIIIVCNVSDRRSVHPSQVSWFKSFCPSRTEPLRVLVQAREEAAAEKKAKPGNRKSMEIENNGMMGSLAFSS